MKTSRIASSISSATLLNSPKISPNKRFSFPLKIAVAVCSPLLIAFAFSSYNKDTMLSLNETRIAKFFYSEKDFFSMTLKLVRLIQNTHLEFPIGVSILGTIAFSLHRYGWLASKSLSNKNFILRDPQDLYRSEREKGEDVFI